MRSQHLLAGAALAVGQAAADPEVLPTPPMGYNNWARFMCNLNETLFKDTADAMLDKGLLDAGYDRINLDDCWMTTERHDNGSVKINETLFPSGIAALGDYIHERGFHFGIYQDAGNLTCGGFAGSLGYEEIDAQDFVNWGVDYLKLDGCYVPELDGLDLQNTYKKIYSHWHDIFSAMDDPLIFSESAPAYFCDEDDLTDWYNVMDWVPSYGELARHSWDIAVHGSEGTWDSILANYGANVLFARYQKPGYYNDPDYIIPDWPDLTMDEKRSQFAIWCAFSAPLIISAHIPDLTDEDIAYLTNQDLIDIDQDEKAEQAALVSQDGTWDVLTRSLANGDRVVAALNRGDEPASQKISAERLGLVSDDGATYQVKDLWTGETTEATTEVDTGEVPSHGTAIFRISGVKDVIPTGMLFNTASKLCLDAADAIITTNCSAADSQVWQVREDGSIRSLADTESCLAEKDGKAESAACKEGEKSQVWTYKLHGYVVNAGSENCLTEGAEGTTVEKCGGKDNQQVFALPVGGKIVA